MIHSLRKKFILINMSLISIVLITVFTILCLSNYNQLEQESIDAMEHELFDDRNTGQRIAHIEERENFKEHPPNMTPVFLVELNSDSSIKEVLEHPAYSVSADLAEEAAALALQQNQDTGTIKDLQLRFKIADSSGITKIAFADQTHTISSMKNLILNSILVTAAALIAFFVISVFLSKWALLPVTKAWERQRQFVADASHELKTPLTVILANTNIILSHKNDLISNQLKWLENTQTEASRMKKLVEHLLFLAKSDAEELPELVTSVDFSDLIWSCLLPFESIAFEQKILIQEEIEPGLELLGNQEQLKQLVMILLDNACKYAGANGKIQLSLKKEAARIRLMVRNSGALIPAEDIDHIFERFYRTSKSRARKEGGYGLGLAIAKSIVEKHKGSISAASSTAEGTTFYVSFH